MVWSSEHGYEVRSLIDAWDKVLVKETKDRNIKMFLSGQQFVMYFIYNNDVYGCSENSRVTYSRMLQPDEETTEDWIKEANFMAFNISKAIQGKPAQEMFDHEDVDKIQVISKEIAYDELVKVAEKASQQDVMTGTKALFQALKSMGKKNDIPLNQGVKR